MHSDCFFGVNRLVQDISGSSKPHFMKVETVFFFFALFLSPLVNIPLQILGNNPQCVNCPDVADGVAALVGWPSDGA